MRFMDLFLKHFLCSLICFSIPLLSDQVPTVDEAPTKEKEQKMHLPALQELEVNLKEPIFSDGVLKTTKGGIITARGMRIQARKIAYTNKVTDDKKIVQIQAEEDLLLEYEGRFFVGSKLEYDFVNHTGTILNARTADGIWFVGGDTVELKEDGSFLLQNAFLTTCESQENTWEIRSKAITVTEEHQLTASNIHLNLFHIPFLWLPSFKSNLNFVSDPPIRYRLTWDKGVGPRATIRYRVLSLEEFSLYSRLDYRLEKGFGAAIESEYFSKDKRTTFVTRSYGAHDKVVYDESGLHRYRLQGLFTHLSLNEKTYTHLTYDKLSDLKMISDFATSDFEVDTQKRTRLLINHQENFAFGTLNFEPRINPFESCNQNLPLVKTGIKPFSLGGSGIISENTASGGYLDYVYAHDLLQSHPTLHETHSSRFETRNRLYRPFSAGPIHFTPSASFIGIFYGNNEQGTSSGQGLLTYGASLSSPLYKSYPGCRHSVEPYVNYLALTKPKSPLENHYIFNIDDGLYQINSLRIGLKNNLSFLNAALFSPNLSLDLYTLGFFNDKTFDKAFPKGYVSAVWNRPFYAVEGTSCWNFEESLVDFYNMLTEITVNEHAAFALEFRHRSRFDWRKADHENFILDMARPINELINSPLSDGRNTFLGRLQVRLSPKWTCHFASHYGWGRNSEPSYTTFKIDATTLLSSKWQLKFSYLHTTNDDRFSMQMQLTK